jgi:hypothetical protein
MDDKCCPVGPGGNTTIVNQDEADLLAQVVQGLETRSETQIDAEAH